MMPTSPALTADCVVFDGEGRLLLIRRRNEPYAGRYALPGGFVEAGERVEAAALRELKEETGVAGEIERLIGVYSDPERDPRGHTVSVAYLVRTSAREAKGGDDASEAVFVRDWRGEPLAFDHARIVADALKLRQASASSANP
jgi:8-oxo-dGTP diphosphatase